ncbi:hypothetical protein [Stenotrophomonas acidaminiphila]|uniref:hypothetical protein n=1 Tax=Stenotrophomonas acidaminiphila TaxID=128780 RepID=UPI0015FB1083|nr:hypothetical protein [Stenotrophomonas acidaminiphila]
MNNVLGSTPWLLPLPVLAGGGRVAVPERITGHWAARPGACAPDADDLVLRIAPRHFACRESDGPITAVVLRGDTGMALIAGLPGEGGTWLSTAGFRRSADGRRRVAPRTGRQRPRYRRRAPAGTPSHSPSMPAAPSGVTHSPRQETS